MHRSVRAWLAGKASATGGGLRQGAGEAAGRALLRRARHAGVRPLEGELRAWSPPRTCRGTSIRLEPARRFTRHVFVPPPDSIARARIVELKVEGCPPCPPLGRGATIKIVALRFFIDPSTGEPHIYGHNVSEAELEDVLARPMEDRPGSEGSRVGSDEASNVSSRLGRGTGEASPCPLRTAVRRRSRRGG